MPNQTREMVNPGGFACAGCGETIAFRHITRALGPRTSIITSAGCGSVVDGYYPFTASKTPFFHCSFGTAGATAAGLKAGYEILERGEVTVLAWAGDGGTFDIGLQSLSGAAERNDDILYVCYDNEAYMNTGGQRSSATPQGSWSATTPDRKQRPKKDLSAIMAAHGLPYLATASISDLKDLETKVGKARCLKGFKFIHVLTPCPTGWLFPAKYTIRVARLAVASRVFPLYEVMDGDKYQLSPMEDPITVRDYLALQKRFKAMSEAEIDLFQQDVNKRWTRLQALAACG